MFKIKTYQLKEEAGRQAALHGAELINKAIKGHEQAHIILATGASLLP